MAQPAPGDAVRLVAMGDSTVQAIGADRPMDGYVGRIATYIEARTGREHADGPADTRQDGLLTSLTGWATAESSARPDESPRR